MLSAHGRCVAVVGLGYVGLPVAVAFARSGAPTIGFDIDSTRIAELKKHHDRTREVTSDELREVKLDLTESPADLAKADFFIVTVPTPIDTANRPDMRIVEAASRMVGGILSKGAIIVYESTVYPGATEEICIPILEMESGLKCGVDFKLGYSPERINPGDSQRRFESIRKVVAGQDTETLETVAAVYSSVVQAGVHKAPSIKVAEAAKVIENTQRDLNIALMNELSLIFNLLDIDTSDVLAAAGTKWNFLRFSPGLVGGHCIGVDPYYLTHKAEEVGYYPQVILAGRRINDQMGAWIASECVKMSYRQRQKMGCTNGTPLSVVVLGITFKENVPDLRNSKVVDVIRELGSFGVSVQVADPLASSEACEHEYGVTLTPFDSLTRGVDAVILAVPHQEYVQGGWRSVIPLLNEGGIVIDVRSVLPREDAPDHLHLWRL